VVLLDITQEPPVAVEVGIYSSSAAELTLPLNRICAADIISTQAASYHEAQENLKRYVGTVPPYAWMIPLMHRNLYEDADVIDALFDDEVPGTSRADILKERKETETDG
jgi:hypothetical protein